MSKKKTKSQIDKEMTQLEKEFTSCRNELEVVQVYNKMEYIMDSELEAWEVLADQSPEMNNKEQLEFQALYHKETENLNSVKALITERRTPLLAKAQEIYRARKRSHVGNIYTRYVSPECDDYVEL